MAEFINSFINSVYSRDLLVPPVAQKDSSHFLLIVVQAI